MSQNKSEANLVCSGFLMDNIYIYWTYSLTFTKIFVEKLIKVTQSYNKS